MSPRAAWRLEAFGFTDVYDYVAGKVDWLAAGLETHGTNARSPRAADVARRDVPTCHVHEILGVVRPRVVAGAWEACVVVNEQRVVIGLLRADELKSDEDATIETIMRPGPSTFRPFVAIRQMATYMAEHDLASCPITTSGGVLIGLLLREDATRIAAPDELP